MRTHICGGWGGEGSLRWIRRGRAEGQRVKEARTNRQAGGRRRERRKRWRRRRRGEGGGEGEGMNERDTDTSRKGDTETKRDRHGDIETHT